MAWLSDGYCRNCPAKPLSRFDSEEYALDYLPLTIMAMLLLGVHYFLVKLISRHVSGPTVALLGCLLIVPVIAAYIYFTETPFVPEQTIYLVYTSLITLILAIGVLTLYMAIQRGPISVVMPIYGLNAMITALLGILFLHEAVSVEKALGLVLAIAAIVLLRQ
jgi:transporter family protein